MKPSVDVIVPCYNYGALLEACVASILSQEGVRTRVLVMDDASCDETEAVGRRLAAADPRVDYTRHEVNQGHIATYNEALARIAADYCMVLSADDLLTAGALARATDVMEAHPEVGLTFGRDIPFEGTPPPDVRWTETCPPRIVGYVEFLVNACRLGHTGIQAPTALVRSSVQWRTGGFLPELPHSGDTEIWLRMAVQAAVAEVDAPQAFRRLHAANMSLSYSPLARLAEQKRAFDIHFRDHAPLVPEVRLLQAVMHRTIAESAFWSAARAFDGGDPVACEAFLEFASATCPGLESWGPWRRLAWKRRIGPSTWRVVEPLAASARRLTRPFAAVPPVNRN